LLAFENGIPSMNFGAGMNSAGQVSPLINVNGQELDFDYGSINAGVSQAHLSLSNQLASLPLQKSTYRPLNRALMPVVWADPLQFNGFLGEGESYIPQLNWYDNLNLGTTVWNHWATRAVIPDFISIGGGYSGMAIFGGTSSIELQWVTRGPEASFYPAITATQGIGVGYSIDATINIGMANYLGNVNDISRSMLQTSIGDGGLTYWGAVGATLGGKVGVTGSYTPTREGYGIINKTINVGVGLPIGPIPVNGAVGVSNTWIIYDFYN
jgi:hypothetical protein